MHIFTKAFVAVLAMLAALAHFALEASAQEPPGSQERPIILELLDKHWDEMPQRSRAAREPFNYSGTVPVCDSPIPEICVINGNTIWANVKTTKVHGVTVPHPDGQCEAERQLAAKASERLAALLSSGRVTIAQIGHGYGGKIAANVLVNDQDVGQILTQEGLAGTGDRDAWCKELHIPAEPVNELGNNPVQRVALISVVFGAAKHCGFSVPLSAWVEALNLEKQFSEREASKMKKLRREIPWVKETVTDLECNEWRQLAKKEDLLAANEPTAGDNDESQQETQNRTDTVREYQVNVAELPDCGNSFIGDCIVDARVVRLGGDVFRLDDISSPQPHGQCEAEQLLGKLAVDRLGELLSGAQLSIEPHAIEDDGVISATIKVGEQTISQVLLEENLAIKRDDEFEWCDDKKSANVAEEPITWAQMLNPDGDIPETGFKAIYFSRGSVFFPKVLVEHTDSIAVNFGRRGPNRISAKRFAGYWVGKLSFDKPAIQTISVSGGGKARIRIDGVSVYESSKSYKQFNHEFSSGQHVIEVEYINTWHTIDFKVSLTDTRTPMPRTELAALLENMGLEHASLYYVGLSAPSTKDFTLEVDTSSFFGPVVLWLDSYDAVDWKVTGDNEVAAVILSSLQGGTSVSGERIGEILYPDTYIGVSRLSHNCACHRTHLHCQNKNDLLDAADTLLESTGLELSGFQVSLNPDRVSFQPFDQQVVAQLKEIRSMEQRLEQICRP